MYAERVLPHDIEAEEAVIGSLLIDGEAILHAATIIKPDDFFRERYRWCYQGCLALFDRREPIDQATLGHELARDNRLEEVGGYEFLSELAATVPTSVNIGYYAEIVRRTSVMRQLIRAASEIAVLGYENDADIDDTLSRAEDTLFRIRTGRGARDFEHLREVMDRILERQAAATAGPLERGAAPIPSSFTDLDQILGGLQRSDLLVLAARPGLGKTALAIGIGRNAARLGANVGVFSLEMSGDQLGLRLLAAEAGVDGHRLRLGIYTEAEERRIVDVAGILSGLPMYIDDTPSLGIVELRSKARRLQMERGVDLIIVDYIQLIHGTGDGRQQNRVQEVSDITRSLKGLARDLNVPVIAVSQLSRAVENRPSHRPQLSDLRESGSIEQDADVVMFIHREDLHLSEEEWERRSPDAPFPRSIAEIIVAKHRHGPMGSIHLRFQERLARFEDMNPQEGI